MRNWHLVIYYTAGPYNHLISFRSELTVARYRHVQVNSMSKDKTLNLQKGYSVFKLLTGFVMAALIV